MEEFKMKVKYRIALFAGLTLAAAALGIYNVFFMPVPDNATMTDGVIVGFQSGLILGIGMIAVVQIFKLTRVVNDETKLKLLYNQEHDERLKAIRSMAGMPMLMITSVLMLIAAIIAGYFNIVVFYTLVLAATAQLTIGAIVKLVCMKTM
ncbi:hypothetical protein [Acetobacterium bakii]|uniref:DUF2178 domain-containing protein n=1 Tax=Acetobacterium bakii TaxID=52689 RepID=A0A0L6TXR3_9FIRM|nr:hypothetical protein [Acetobacterium bakii]KNZ40345.1 hypothetical protein AKG39_18320 [Acetobacterium bakii]